jgi:hypothetical protein
MIGYWACSDIRSLKPLNDLIAAFLLPRRHVASCYEDDVRNV